MTIDLESASKRLEAGESLRMVAKSIGTDHSSLSRLLKKAGYRVPTREESATRTWKNHKHPNLGRKGELSYNYGRKMSEAHREKMKPIWKENGDQRRLGRKRHTGGYILTYAPDNPYADKEGYVLEHRFVMEKALGRVLSPDEVVHHLNGDKQDNRVENLCVLSRAEHAHLHYLLRLEATTNA